MNTRPVMYGISYTDMYRCKHTKPDRVKTVLKILMKYYFAACADVETGARGNRSPGGFQDVLLARKGGCNKVTDGH